MKGLFKFIPFLFITICLISCGGSHKLQNNINLISAGQSKEDVIKIFGNPQNKQFNGSDEAWQYFSSGMSNCKFVIIWFYDSKVTGVNTYNTGTTCISCANCFKPINWVEKPDRTIEIRNRDMN